MAHHIKGDILASKEQYLVHQLNGVSRGEAKGLAAVIFAAMPWANVYMERASTGERDPLGALIVRGDGDTRRFVAGIVGQVYPGAPKYATDSAAVRIQAFSDGLEKLALLHPTSVAFPHRIGCGYGRGDWETYETMIEKFALAVGDTCRVVIYDNT